MDHAAAAEHGMVAADAWIVDRARMVFGVLAGVFGGGEAGQMVVAWSALSILGILAGLAAWLVLREARAVSDQILGIGLSLLKLVAGAAFLFFLLIWTLRVWPFVRDLTFPVEEMPQAAFAPVPPPPPPPQGPPPAAEEPWTVRTWARTAVMQLL